MRLTIPIPKETKLDGMNSYQVEAFVEIKNVPEGIPWNIFTELGRYMQESQQAIPHFDSWRNILDNFYLDYVCIEYTDATLRDADKKNNQERYQLINLFQSKPQDEQGRQIARNVWEFEYNGKYYLIVSPRNTPLPDETIPEKWIFKSIIVNQDAYSWIVPSATQGEIRSIQAQVEHLIGKPGFQEADPWEDIGL